MFEVRQRQREVSADVSTENNRQLAKWGVQDHPLLYWFAILLEEVGEVAEAILAFSPDLLPAGESFLDDTYELGLRAKAYIEGREPDGISRVNDAVHEINLDAEIIQCAAVAVAMCESLRRTNAETVAA